MNRWMDIRGMEKGTKTRNDLEMPCLAREAPTPYVRCKRCHVSLASVIKLKHLVKIQKILREISDTER